jgi:hypothetical protein
MSDELVLIHICKTCEHQSPVESLATIWIQQHTCDTVSANMTDLKIEVSC